MATFDILEASLKLKDGTLHKILNPKLESKKGNIHVDGVLNASEFNGIKDIEQKLDIKAGVYKSDEEYFFTIVGTSGFGEEIELLNVHYCNINYTSLQVEFICYDSLILKMKSNYITNDKDYISAIAIEGMELQFEKCTTIEQKRNILGQEEKRMLSSNRDYTETNLSFIFQKNQYNLNLSFIKDDKTKNIIIRFDGENKLDLLTYKAIKFQLRSFLSFAIGNTLVFREENYFLENTFHRKIYSAKKVKNKIRSRYIPVANIHFRQYHILHNYLKCFDTYLIADKYLYISEVIFLLNQAKRVDIESSFFIMLVALEKLSDKFVKSSLNTITDEYIIDENVFKTQFTNTKIVFEADFKNIKKADYDRLKSKLCGINKKENTNKKFDKLLEFAEIKKTTEIEALLTTLRNKAIHEGEMNFPVGSGFENYRTLELLLNDIIANLIQYKGKRFIKAEATANIYDEKTTYLFDYSPYR